MKDRMVRDLTRWATHNYLRWGPTVRWLEESGRQLDLELARLRRIEAAAREVVAGEMPHECWHPELRDALGEAP